VSFLVGLRTYQHPLAHTHTHIHTYVHTYIHIYIHTYIPTYTHTYIPTYTHTYIPTYTHIHTYIHTYIHTQTHTYIHRHIHTHTYIHTLFLSTDRLPQFRWVSLAPQCHSTPDAVTTAIPHLNYSSRSAACRNVCLQFGRNNLTTDTSD